MSVYYVCLGKKGVYQDSPAFSNNFRQTVSPYDSSKPYYRLPYKEMISFNNLHGYVLMPEDLGLDRNNLPEFILHLDETWQKKEGSLPDNHQFYSRSIDKYATAEEKLRSGNRGLEGTAPNQGLDVKDSKGNVIHRIIQKTQATPKPIPKRDTTIGDLGYSAQNASLNHLKQMGVL